MKITTDLVQIMGKLSGSLFNLFSDIIDELRSCLVFSEVI